MAYTGFVLLSLVTYELWLGGFLFFIALDWYRRRVSARALTTPWMWRYGGIAAPFLIFAALFTTSAEQAFHSMPGVLILAAEAVVLALLSVSWVRGALCTTGSQIEIAQARVPVWESLVLAWSLLLGSRIVLILQQSISRFDTRLAYGASMGIAVAGVALVSGAIHHRLVGVRLRAMAGPMVLVVVLVLGWASAGVGVHYANSSQAEAQTLRTLEHWIASSSSPIRLPDHRFA